MDIRIEDVRRWNARYLADQSGGLMRFAEKLDRAQPQISHIIGKNPTKAIERVLARHIETCFGKPEGWMDTPHIREWLNIGNKRWNAELRAWMLERGIEVRDDVKVGPEVELISLFAVLNENDKKRLIDIARVLAAGAKVK